MIERRFTLTLVSFDNFAVCETAEECIPEIFTAVDAQGKLATKWGQIKR